MNINFNLVESDQLMSEKRKRMDEPSESLEHLSASLKRFGVADYCVFAFMLLVCSFIGLYFGYKDHEKHKRHSNERRGSEELDYLLGGKNLQVFPGMNFFFLKELKLNNCFT